VTPTAFVVLMVEDDVDDVDMTREALKEAKLYVDLRVARDGEAAMRYLKKQGEFSDAQTPDMIFLDLNLPGIDGREVLRRIKEDTETRRIPVVLLTSSREESDIVTGYENGTNSYIVKPVDFTQFGEAMRTIGMYWLLINTPPALQGADGRPGPDPHVGGQPR